ncbi:MAG: FAD-binding oxidoreductase, partial [Granulosicoccus sp.]
MTASTAHHTHLSTLADELASKLQGECDFSDAALALYTCDASNYRQIPLGVVYPANIADIVIATRVCREHGQPVLMRGGGTSQNGQCANEAVILDCSRHLQQVIEIDEQNKSALVQPGIICDSLKAEAETLGLTFGPDPATHSRCTLGGMIGNNSCGPRSMLAGKTVENVLELEVLTSDGARFWTGPTSESELESILAQGDRQ